MFIVFLKFSDNKSQAGQYMEDHNAWLKKGFDDGVFLLAGSLQPGLGGAIIADGADKEALQSRVADDPFVQRGVVVAELHEVSPAKTDDRLSFLRA